MIVKKLLLLRYSNISDDGYTTFNREFCRIIGPD